jgi:hypothetical protein
MISISPPVKIKFGAKLKRIEERFREKWLSGHGDTSKFEKISIGWFIHLEGSWESLFIGYEKPDLNVGDNVIITIEGPSRVVK